MDRRGFLRVLGVGGVLVAAAPKLLVPPARNVGVEPQRTIFLPPNGGWDIGALKRAWDDQWTRTTYRSYPWSVYYSGPASILTLEESDDLVSWRAIGRYSVSGAQAICQDRTLFAGRYVRLSASDQAGPIVALPLPESELFAPPHLQFYLNV